TLARLGAGAGAAVPTLIPRLADEDERVRTEALEALERIGPVAAAGLRQAVKDKDPRLRAAVIQALPRFAPEAESVLPTLLAQLRDADAGVRLAAINPLARLRVRPPAKKSAVPQLIEALKDKDAPVRAAAANALRGMGPLAKAAAPTLIEALKDDVG